MIKKRVLYIFLSYAFEPKQDAYSKEEIKKVLCDSINLINKQFDIQSKNVQIKLIYKLKKYGNVLTAELLAKIKSADIFIVDISDNNPNVFYELGYIDAIHKNKAIIIKSNKKSSSYNVPSDISDRFYLKYDSISDISEEITLALREHIKEILNEPLDLNEKRKLWFTKDVKTITVIGSKSQVETEFSKTTSSNYTHFQKFANKDAMFVLISLLTKLYPDANIKKCVAEEVDLNSGLIKDNLVVIGGPGDNGKENKISALISKLINSTVSYSNNCEIMHIKNNDAFSAVRDSKKNIIKDYGYFGRIKNPFDNNFDVIMIHGIHTFGVLGATQVFSDDDIAVKNIEIILNKLDNHVYFESWFSVKVIGDAIIIPQINIKNIRKLDKVSYDKT